jgi:bacillolysin
MGGKKTKIKYSRFIFWGLGVLVFPATLMGMRDSAQFHPSTQPVISPSLDKITAALRTVSGQCLNLEQKSNLNNSAKKNRIVSPAYSPSKIDAGLLKSPSGSEVRFNHQNGSAKFIRLRSSLGRGETAGLIGRSTLPRQTALACLHENRDLLKVQNAYDEFAPKREFTDALGSTHVKYQQRVKGLNVWGKEVIVHVDRGGTAYLIEGNSEPTPQIDTTPVLIAAEAEAKVSQDMGGLATGLKSELLVHADRLGITRLAYSVQATCGLELWRYFIDARTGMILEKYNDTWFESVSGSGTDLKGQSQNFQAWKQDGSFYLIDTSLPMYVRNPALPGNMGQGNAAVLDLKNQESENYTSAEVVRSASPAAGWDPSGVSVLCNLKVVCNYYKNTLNRNSVDNQSRNAVTAVHVGRNYENAFWQSDVQMIFLGDGGNTLYSLGRGLDVLAHEFTHGVIQYTANLEYKYQSGALNEAFADIFACMIDRGNWTLGEDVLKVSPGFLRSLSNPHEGLSRLPASMNEYRNLALSDDNGGVHTNCSIPGRACYLAAEGLTKEGTGTSIGREKTEQIFYRALVQHMTRQSDFSDCRRATVQSAEELYGTNSVAAASIKTAWDIVGVSEGGTGGNGGGGGGTPNTGSDNLIFLFYMSNLPFLGLKFTDGTEYFVSRNPVATARPVVIRNGQAVLYVDIYNNLRMASLSPNNTFDQSITTEGFVRSICGSADGRYFAFTTTACDSKLYLLDTLDTTGKGNRVLDLSWPNDGGTHTTTLRFADVIHFDPAGTKIIFDALSEMTVNGTTTQAWNIGAIEIASGKISSLIPSQPEGLNVGNPAPANLTDGILAFDMVDTATKTSRTMAMNINTGQSGLIAEEKISQNFGWPVFLGDDASVAVQYRNNIVRVPLVTQNDGTVVGDFASNEVVRNSSFFPQFYRPVSGINSGKIRIDPASLTFDDSLVGQPVVKELKITNVGSVPLKIDHFEITDPVDYSLAGQAGSLDPNGSLILNVTFNPITLGGKLAVLTVRSDDPEYPAMEVQVMGRGVEILGPTPTPSGEANPTPIPSPESTSSEAGPLPQPFGGGCFIATAAYGSYMAQDVIVLRQFRDHYLLTNGPGRSFVKYYYRYSPPIANFIAPHPVLRAIVRALLTPLVVGINHPLMMVGLVLLLIALAVSYRLCRREGSIITSAFGKS